MLARAARAEQIQCHQQPVVEAALVVEVQGDQVTLLVLDSQP